MRRTGLGLLIAASALVAAVGATASPRERSGSRVCTPYETRATFDGFVRAFNLGEAAALDRLVASPHSFVWFSVSGAGPRLGNRSRDRSTLLRYFETRHALRDRLVDISFSGGGNSNGYGHFTFRLTRSADDELPSRYEGKGAVLCEDAGNTIAVWSMGRRGVLPIVAPPTRRAPLRSVRGASPEPTTDARAQVRRDGASNSLLLAPKRADARAGARFVVLVTVCY